MGLTELFEIITGVVGGVAIFLLGMKNMSEGMQAVAGSFASRMSTNRSATTLSPCCPIKV